MEQDVFNQLEVPGDRLWDWFADLPDPRRGKSKPHKFIDIVMIAVCAITSGCDSFPQIAAYACAKEAWLRTWLELPNGIPSHDTFYRVLSLLDPTKLQECLMRFGAALHQATGGRIVAIDGKTLRGSIDRAAGKSAIHIVSAWATESCVSLGQLTVDAKSNEITAIPALLELLKLDGAIVTIDAAGCQRAIATTIRKQKADYVLALKENQPTLHHDVESHFAEVTAQPTLPESCDKHETHEKAHGREEHRTAYSMPVPETIRNRDEWRDLRSIGMIQSRRVIDGKEQSQTRYFLSSLEADAKQLAGAGRSHWGIENSLHWVLDVTFREDDNRLRKRNGPQVLAALRRLAVTMLKRVEPKQTMPVKRLRAGWDDDFMLQVLLAIGDNQMR